MSEPCQPLVRPRREGFDEQPLPGLDSEALDFRAASESFAAFRKRVRRDLETLRLLTDPCVLRQNGFASWAPRSLVHDEVGI